MVTPPTGSEAGPPISVGRGSPVQWGAGGSGVPWDRGILIGQRGGIIMTPRNPWRVFIIHGFDASPEEHWFPWLEAQLRERGIQVTRLRMPDSSYPDFDRWQATMR